MIRADVFGIESLEIWSWSHDRTSYEELVFGCTTDLDYGT